MIKLDQSALDAPGDQIAQSAEDAVNRGIAAANGQASRRSGMAVADEFAKAGLEPNRDGIRTKLVELGWEE